MRPLKPDRPAPAQAFRLDARPFGSGRARSSRAAASKIRPGSRLGGRPARSRHSRSSLAAGLAASPMAKRRSRKLDCVGVEAEDFGASRGALKRQARAQRPGCRRVAAQDSVEQRERQRRRRRGDRPALPFRSPAPRTDAPAERKGLLVQGLSRRSASPARAVAAARERPRRGRRRGRERGSESARITSAHGESLAALCHAVWCGYPPRLSFCGRCPISLPYRT